MITALQRALGLRPDADSFRTTYLWVALISVSALILTYTLFRTGTDYSVALVIAAVPAILLVILVTPPERTLVAVLFVVVFLNVGNYSFLTFRADGEGQTAALSPFLKVVRFPILAGVIIGALLAYGGRYWDFVGRNADVIVLGFCALVSGAMGYNLATGITYGAWFALALVAALAYVLYHASHGHEGMGMTRFARLMLWSNVLLIIFALAALPNFDPSKSLALEGTFTASNVHSFAASVVVGAALILAEREKDKWAGGSRAWIYFVIAVVAVGTMILGGRRSAMGGIAGAGVIWLFFLRPDATRSLNTYAQRVGIAIAIGVVIWAVLPSATYTQMRISRGLGEYDGSTQSRIEIAKFGLLMWQQQPVTGLGLANAREASLQFGMQTEMAGYGLHNSYLAVLVEFGLLGTVAFLFIFFRSVWLWTQMERRSRAELAMIAIPTLLVCSTEYNLAPGQFMFWPFVLCILMPRVLLLTRATTAEVEEADRRFVHAPQGHRPVVGVPPAG